MAGIQPTNIPIIPRQGPQAGNAGAAKQGPTKTAFADAMKNVIDIVDHDQQVSASSIRDLIAGKSQDILPVVQAAAKADLSFKLLMGVRNKVIEAYKQTMQMQV